MSYATRNDRLIVVSEAQLARIKRLGIRLRIVTPPAISARHKLPMRRQTEILQKMASGYSTKEIAQNLRRSIKTVETHRSQLIERIGVHHIPALVRYALQSGVLPASWLLEWEE